MTKKDNKDAPTGPQGTQVFDVDAVNKMIAAEIAESQTTDANIPALTGVSANVSGQRFILDKDKIEVGRRPNSDIVLDVSSVSAMHAQVIRQGEKWKVLNLLSSNGTFVNGEKIVEKEILPGDRVAFAGAEFVFTLIDEPHPRKRSNKNLALVLVATGLVAAFGGLLYFII